MTSDRGVADGWGSEVSIEEVHGNPCRMFVNRRVRVADVLDDAARFGSRTYLVDQDTQLTLAQLTAAADVVAVRLQTLGVVPGDRVMIFGRNCVEWVVAFWAVMRCGAVAVLANTWWTDDELDHATSISRPVAVICEAQARERFGGIEVVSFSGLTSAIQDAPSPVRSVVAEDEPAVVMFSSGTTGRAKGIVLSQRAVLANLQNLLVLSRRLPRDLTTESDPSVTLLSVPIFHVGGVQQILTSALTGGRLIFTGRRFDAAEVLRTIELHSIKAWAAVPTMVGRVLDAIDAGAHADLSSVRMVTLGGAPVTESLRQRVRTAFPNAVRGTGVSYGLTEAGGVVAAGAGHDVATHPGTVGRLVPLAEVRIESANDLGIGEILVRSPSVMDGYLGADKDEDSFVAGRWLRTGDLGRLDANGFLYVTGRAKDIVIRGGENISCAAVEAAIAEHPSVRQVAVLGVPHPDLGEEVAAVAVLREGASLNHAELRQHLEGRVAPTATPTVWQVRTQDLPINAAGKIAKAQLSAELRAETSGAVAAQTVVRGRL